MKTLKKFILFFKVFKSLIFVFLCKPHKKKVVLVLTEHLGDIVAAEPIARFLKSKYISYELLWVVNSKYADIVRPNPYVNQVVNIDSLSEWFFLKKILSKTPKFKIFDLHFGTRYCLAYGYRLVNSNNNKIDLSNYFYHGNLLEVFSKSIGIDVLLDRPRIFLKPIEPDVELPCRYIVLHTKSNDGVKQWCDKKWAELIHSFSNFSDIVFVEVGFVSTLEIRTQNYLNLCGILSFGQISYLIKNSFCFLGIDSSFAHFANALDAKSFILFGHYKNFKSYMPYSGVNKFHGRFRILRHNGPLVYLPFEIVFDEFVYFVNE